MHEARERVNHLKTLAQFHAEYERVLHSDMSPTQKSQKYAELMTHMEREFCIPALRNSEFEKKNPAVISLYRILSNSRW
jgi:hypothetical protein